MEIGPFSSLIYLLRNAIKTLKLWRTSKGYLLFEITWHWEDSLRDIHIGSVDHGNEMAYHSAANSHETELRRLPERSPSELLPSCQLV